jgi:hypothetical protein
MPAPSRPTAEKVPADPRPLNGKIRAAGFSLMRAYPVGQRVGSVRNNEVALLDPVALAA